MNAIINIIILVFMVKDFIVSELFKRICLQTNPQYSDTPVKMHVVIIFSAVKIRKKLYSTCHHPLGKHIVRNPAVNINVA